MATTWSFDHSVIYCILHLRIVIANNISLVIGVAKDRSEGCRNVTMFERNLD
jgi:hypothetical protein